MLLFTGCAFPGLEAAGNPALRTTAAPLDAEQTVSERPSDKKEKEKIPLR